jgi:hypothetical protein
VAAAGEARCAGAGNPELAERELVQAAKRCEGLPDEDRIALADKLADRAMTYLHRAQELAALARRVRGGEG